jgi:hypothetical protein
MAIPRWVEIPRQNHVYNIIDAYGEFRLLDYYKNGDGLLQNTTTGEKVKVSLDKIRYLKNQAKTEDVRKCGKPIDNFGNLI